MEFQDIHDCSTCVLSLSPQTLLSRFLFTYQIFERANLDWELGVIILQEYLHKQTQNVTMQVACLLARENLICKYRYWAALLAGCGRGVEMGLL